MPSRPGPADTPTLRQVKRAVRQRALTSARHLLDRLPNIAQRPSRRAVAIARRSHERRRGPLVSLVIPVYGVERYLAACLESVIAQTHRRLQVVLVDDGSPDRSIDIMLAYAERDPRIEILRQPNRGLGAARNAGARAARGKYLMFVDSDDTLQPNAVRAHVRSLRRTGSDFSVASYRRISSAGQWPAAWWIQNAHRVPRPASTLTESPEILVNAVAWSKCYRRRFWLANELWFPEGVLYEDQAVSARAYARARSFDVLTAVLYNWRVRDELNSISQQVSQIGDLQARFAAARASLAELDQAHLADARAARLAQYLNNDFPISIRAAQHAGSEFTELLRAELTDLTRDLPAPGEAGSSVWDRVGVQHRIAVRMVVAGLWDELFWFVGLGHDNPKQSPSVVADGAVYLDTEARRFLELERTDPLLRFAEHQMGLVTAIRRAYWSDAGVFRVEGWAYIDNVSLADPSTPFEIAARCVLREDPSVVVNLPITVTRTIDVTVASRHRYADYERSGFVMDIDPRLLLEPARPDPSSRVRRWQLIVDVHAGGIARSGRLIGLDGSGSAGRLAAAFVDGREVVPRYTRRLGLTLDVASVLCSVEAVEIADRILSISVRGHAGFLPGEIELVLESGSAARPVRRIRQPLRRLGEGVASGQVAVPQPEFDEDEFDSAQSDQWTVRIVSLAGVRTPAACLADPGLVTRAARGSLRAAITRFGNLMVLDEPYGVTVDDASVDNGVLHVAGTSYGIDPDDLELLVAGAPAKAVGLVTPDADGRFRAEVALQDDPWGFGERPLPSATYVLHARRRSPSLGDVPVRLDRALVNRLPIPFVGPHARGSVRLGARGLQILLEPPLADNERGARSQQLLQQRLADLVPSRRHEPGAVLFRTYFGEIAGCNALAVHRELMRRKTGHRLYWAVKDESVTVPDGGIPVIHNSAEWYRLLHDAEFYLDNMHQPIYHRKPPHQIQVQTFHGYPFKQMGLSHWAHQRRDRAHVQSYLERAKDWDYLVSPARYGTTALCESFGFSGEVLEIGYPRNDILRSASAAAIAASVRQRLGIRSDQTVVLYAPTFRDELTRDDFSARMIDFLDVPQLAAALGPSFVVLIRGHAFNARTSRRHHSTTNTIDVTDYPDIAGLTLASDVAVLDYSSLRFDYGLTGKPMVFLVPDLEQYMEWSRGSILPYPPTAPGPLVRTTDEVVEAIRDLPGVRCEFAAAYEAFAANYLDLDDGHASERLVDRVFEHRDT